MQFIKLINYLLNKAIINSETIISKIRIKSSCISVGKNLKIKGLIYISNQGNIEIGNKVTINSSLLANPIAPNRCSFATTAGAKIIIGDNVGISGAIIYSSAEIEIKENCYIGAGVKIFDTDFHSLNHTDRLNNKDSNVKSEKIKILRNSFIGSQAIILKGVTIGENSVIAAGSIVTRDIPSNEIWGGIPAKFINKNTP